MRYMRAQCWIFLSDNMGFDKSIYIALDSQGWFRYPCMMRSASGFVCTRHVESNAFGVDYMRWIGGKCARHPTSVVIATVNRGLIYMHVGWSLCSYKVSATFDDNPLDEVCHNQLL